MSMKKFLTAILLFDLMAGLLFLGLWERESSAVTAWGNNSGISEEEGERGTEEREAEASGREEQGSKVQEAEVQWDGMETLNNVITGRGGEAAEEVRKIAITFDDGPHPYYTEQLLDGLKERGVHATFFVTGGCVMILADWQNPVNKRVFVDLVLRKNAGCGVIIA